MYTEIHNLSEPEMRALRVEAGQLLKFLRERAGYSQRTFSSAIGLSNHMLVSQVERGLKRLPPDRIRTWAQVLGIEAFRLMQMLFRYYDVESFAILYEHDQGIFSGDAFPELRAFRAQLGSSAS
jgi:transcriptional regulator with XRE-family HTH domain